MPKFKAAGNNYAHDTIENLQDEKKNPKILRRIRQLAYNIPADRFLNLEEITYLTPNIAREYQKLNQITLRRDLEFLAGKNLLITEKGRYRANFEQLHSYLPESSVAIKRRY